MQKQKTVWQSQRSTHHPLVWAHIFYFILIWSWKKSCKQRSWVNNGTIRLIFRWVLYLRDIFDHWVKSHDLRTVNHTSFLDWFILCQNEWRTQQIGYDSFLCFISLSIRQKLWIVPDISQSFGIVCKSGLLKTVKDSSLMFCTKAVVKHFTTAAADGLVGQLSVIPRIAGLAPTSSWTLWTPNSGRLKFRCTTKRISPKGLIKYKIFWPVLQ